MSVGSGPTSLVVCTGAGVEWGWEQNRDHDPDSDSGRDVSGGWNH